MIAIAAAGCNSSTSGTPDGGGGSACPAGTYRWAAQSTGGNEEVTGATFDQNGNLWLTGELIGSAAWGAYTLTSGNTANPTIFVAELDPSGQPLLARVLGTGGQESARIRTAPNGHVWVGGQMNETLDIDGVHLADAGDLAAFLVEFDPATGSAVSGVASATSNDTIVQDLAIAANGDVYIAGHYNGGVQFGSLATSGDAVSSMTGVYVAKYVPGGNDFAWLDGWAGSASGTNDGGAAYGIALAPDGGVLVTGTINGSLQIGNTVLVGDTSATDAGAFFVKLGGSDGSIQWVTQLVPTGTADAETSAIAVDGSGNAYATGYFNGTATLEAPADGSGALTATSSDSGGGTDVLLAKLAPDGTPVWLENVGNGYVSRGDDLAVAGQALYVGGLTGGGTQFGSQTLDGTAKLFAADYDLSGAAQWVRGADTTGNTSDETYALAVGDAGLAIGGSFTEDATLGSAAIDATGEGDAFAALLCD